LEANLTYGTGALTCCPARAGTGKTGVPSRVQPIRCTRGERFALRRRSTEPGDISGIEVAPFTLPVRNPVAAAPPLELSLRPI
jgi:hypothetical protein